MLLFVPNPELERSSDRSYLLPREVAEPRVDRAPVFHDLGDGRTRQRSAACAGMPLSYALVVGIEEVVVLRAYRRDAERAEHEPFEEPGRVREVPFCRA